MADKFSNILIWVVAILVCGLLIFGLLQPLIFEGYADWVFYVRAFLILFALITFAQLRLYNAIVQNTRFAIKLREALLKFIQVVPALERSMKNLNSTMGNVKSSSDAVKKSLDNSSDKTEELTDKLNHIKQTIKSEKK